MGENEYLLTSVHNEFAKRVEEENDRQNHRLTALEGTVTQIANIMSSVERLATNMEYMAKEQKEQGNRLKTLEDRDGEMWRKVVAYFLTAVISATVGYFMSKLGI